MGKPLHKKINYNARIRRYCEYQDWRCYICGEEMTLAQGFKNSAEIQYIIPKSQQRIKGEYNEAAACHSCNQFKGDRPLYEVISQIRRAKIFKRLG